MKWILLVAYWLTYNVAIPAQELRLANVGVCKLDTETLKVRALDQPVGLQIRIITTRFDRESRKAKRIDETARLDLVFARPDVAKIVSLLEGDRPGSVSVGMMLGELRHPKDISIRKEKNGDVHVLWQGRRVQISYTIESIDADLFLKVCKWFVGRNA